MTRCDWFYLFPLDNTTLLLQILVNKYTTQIISLMLQNTKHGGRYRIHAIIDTNQNIVLK